MTKRKDREFEAETERILLLYHHGKINKRKLEEMMAEHMGETAPYFGEEK